MTAPSMLTHSHKHIEHVSHEESALRIILMKSSYLTNYGECSHKQSHTLFLVHISSVESIIETSYLVIFHDLVSFLKFLSVASANRILYLVYFSKLVIGDNRRLHMQKPPHPHAVAASHT